MLGFNAVGLNPVGQYGAVASSATTSPVSNDFTFDYVIDARVNADFIFNHSILGGNVAFIPSAARTIKVAATSTAFNSQVSGFWNMTNPKQPYGLKDPNSTIDITMDWSDWLADIQDTAASFTWSFDNGASQVAVLSDLSTSSVMVASGNSGAKVAATCHITTSSTPPRTEDRTVYLQIEDR